MKSCPPSAPAEWARCIARFQREAKTLASFNHPHITAIYGLEDSDGIKALVLELVEGFSLADRVRQGPIPIEETLAISRQIADALEAANYDVFRDGKRFVIIESPNKSSDADTPLIAVLNWHEELKRLVPVH